MSSTDRTRPAALAAGPAAVAALVLFPVALAVHGDDVAAISRGPLGVAGNVLALASLLLLLVALVRLASRTGLLEDALGPVLLAGAGTTLTAGGAWAQLVLLPVLAVEAPDVAEGGAGLLTAGYVVSFLLMGVGWLLVALRLRGRGLPTTLLVVGSVVLLLPLPTRWFLLAVAVSLLARRETAPAVVQQPVPVTT